MTLSVFRPTYGVILALAMLSLASPSLAQQKMAPAPAAQAPAMSQAPVPPAVQAPAPEAATSLTNSGSRSLKAEAAALRELSPWSMFLSADILVKAVRMGLAFAPLLTWTIFIAKMIELAIARRKLKTALD